ncbi:MAG TPA: hypothetical protein VFZ93_16030 [Albitalea sp.]
MTVMTTDVAQLFTISVREIVPELARRGLRYAFHGASGGWRLGSDARRIEWALHRVYRAAIELQEDGVMSFHAELAPLAPAGCALHVRVGGTGTRRRPGIPADHAAWGRCPVTDAPVRFCAVPGGFVFDATFALPRAMREPLPERASRAEGALAWIVGEDPAIVDSTVREARRHGWNAAGFPSPDEAMRALADACGSPPRLLAVIGSARLPIEAMHALRERLPASALGVYAVAADSPHLGHAAAWPFEVRCHPFGARQWARWAGAPAADPPPGSDGVPNPGRSVSDHDYVLVVDADAVEAKVTRLMIEAMGFRGLAVADAPSAADVCRGFAPVAVVMRVDGPPPAALDAVRELRAAQRQGELPPGRLLVLAPAGDAAVERAALEAGADRVVDQPPTLDKLRRAFRGWQAVRDASGSGA